MRLFVALDLPQRLRQHLSMLAGGLPGARWVPPRNYHLTLRFIGEVAAHEAEEIDAALAGLRVPGFPIVLAGTGSYAKPGRSGGSKTALWVGVERSPALDHLQAKIETALQRIGLEPERRRFQPHVTLARLDGVPDAKLAGWMADHNLFRTQPTPMTHFTLFSSRLSKDDPLYTPEVEYELA